MVQAGLLAGLMYRNLDWGALDTPMSTFAHSHVRLFGCFCDTRSRALATCASLAASEVNESQNILNPL